MVACARTIASSASLLPRDGGVAYSACMNHDPEDSALMLRYRDGDMAAFETLYRRHNDALYRYLLRLSLNPHAAEDIFQDAWSNIIKSRSRYRPTAKFTTFLYRVAHNCFIDYVRRNKRHLSGSDRQPELSEHPGDQPDLEAEKSLARRRLQSALADLPEEQRDAFLLYEEAGLGLDDIAFVSGVSRETAKSRLRYANNKLQAAMADPSGQFDAGHSSANEDSQ